MLIAIVVSLVAAVSNAVVSILQRQIGTDLNGRTGRSELQFLRRPLWYLAMALMILAFACQAVGLRLSGLTVVQPLFATELVWTILILRLWHRAHPEPRQWMGAAMITAGLGGFLVTARPQGGRGSSLVGWLAAAGIIALAVVLAGWLQSRLRQTNAQALALGVVGGLVFAFTAAQLKAVTLVASGGLAAIVKDWHSYVLASSGLLALYLSQHAFNRGHIQATQSGLAIADLVASTVMGVTLFHEHLNDQPMAIVIEAVTILAICMGIYLVTSARTKLLPEPSHADLAG